MRHIRNLIQRRIIYIHHIRTGNQPAEVFTNPLPIAVFTSICGQHMNYLGYRVTEFNLYTNISKSVALRQIVLPQSVFSQFYTLCSEFYRSRI